MVLCTGVILKAGDGGDTIGCGNVIRRGVCLVQSHSCSLAPDGSYINLSTNTLRGGWSNQDQAS